MTQKKIHRVRNVEPKAMKVKTINRKVSDATMNIENRRFTKNNKNHILNNQILAAPKTTFWGTAVDIDI